MDIKEFISNVQSNNTSILRLFAIFITSLLLILYKCVYLLLISLLKCYDVIKNIIRAKPGLALFVFAAILILEGFVINMRYIRDSVRDSTIIYRQSVIIDSIRTDRDLYRQLYKKSLKKVSISADSTVRRGIHTHKVHLKKKETVLKDSVL